MSDTAGHELVDCEDAKVGVLYEVFMSDCCIAGFFTSALMEKRYEPGPAGPTIGHTGGTPDLVALIFANGVTLTNWAQVEMKATD